MIACIPSHSTRGPCQVLILVPCNQSNMAIFAIVNVNSDGLGIGKLDFFSNFFTRSNIAYACMLNCSHSVLHNLSKSLDP
jgi:hypothetical protein